jgi:hypothetical protein
MARESLDLIDAMRSIAKAAHPITGRGIAYKLFATDLIPSMALRDVRRVYRLLKIARERGIIPWRWIVDETRDLEKISAWDDPEDFADAAASQYRRDFWSQQPERVELWSEKGTIRGVLEPVLDRYAIGFRVLHGFSSATVVHDIAANRDRRPLTALYVGDWDPSGLYMSERDLPDRLEEYGGRYITVLRIALTREQLRRLPSFPASDKRKDPRYRWFVANHGARCWEVDALDPRQLRDRVERHIKKCIRDRAAWQRCEQVNKAERESLRDVLSNWAVCCVG